MITLETYLEGFGNLRGFFSMNPTPCAAIVDLNDHKNPAETVHTWS
jgi:hypothetical protein